MSSSAVSDASRGSRVNSDAVYTPLHTIAEGDENKEVGGEQLDENEEGSEDHDDDDHHQHSHKHAHKKEVHESFGKLTKHK